MVSVAAGLARGGLRPWVYSIAPFVYARPVRADPQRRLPARPAGRAGRQRRRLRLRRDGRDAPRARGLRRAHWACRTCAPTCRRSTTTSAPRSTRIVRGAATRPTCASAAPSSPRRCTLPPYAPWRRLLAGGGPHHGDRRTAGRRHLEALLTLRRGRRARRSGCSASCRSMAALPEAFLADLAPQRPPLVVEEHVAQGGAGQMLAYALARRGLAPARFAIAAALGYPSARYGSQKFHRQGVRPRPRQHRRPIPHRRGDLSMARRRVSPAASPDVADEDPPTCRGRSSCWAPAASSAPT